MTDLVRTVHGWKAIADVLACHITTAQRWAAEPFDPLPVRVLVSEPWADSARLLAWQRRRRARASGKRDTSLPSCSLTDVQRLLAKTVNTVKAYAVFAHDPLPIEDLGTARPWAYEEAVRDWVDRQDRAYQAPARSLVASDDRLTERKRRGTGQRERQRTKRSGCPTCDDVPIIGTMVS